jgi:hypothetical protein
MKSLYHVTFCKSGIISETQLNQLIDISAGGGVGGSYSLIEIIPHGFTVETEYNSVAEKSDIFIS